MRGFILELRFHVGGLSLCLSDKSPGQSFCPKGVSPLHKRPKKPTIPDSGGLTLEGNRGVRQIKQPYPAAAAGACVL